MQESIVFLLRVQCRRKESSRLLSHFLMSFLFVDVSMLERPIAKGHSICPSVTLVIHA